MMITRLPPPEPFLPKGAPISVLHGERNLGPAVGRNVLLSQSRADFIHFHDADDLFEPNWCQAIRREIGKGDVDVVFTEISSYHGERLLAERVQGLRPFENADALVRFCLRGAILTSAGTYRASLVRALGGYRECLWQSEDFDFHIRMAAREPSFRVLSDPLIRRVAGEGRSREKLEVWGSALQALELLSKELPDSYLSEVSESAARISSILFKLGARRRAREGFRLALTLGQPSYESQQPLYRWMARRFGPWAAEWGGFLYRAVLPRQVRSLVRAKDAGKGNPI